jgi:hypothetical protein
MIGGELLASLLPARNKTLHMHNVLAQIMAIGMLGLVLLFSLRLHQYQFIEVTLLVIMCTMALLTFADKKRYIVYEMTYIFSSHLTILIAAIALR